MVDSTGAVVDSAKVTAISQNTNIARTVDTNASGFYSITNLAPAHYTLNFEKQGFSAVQIKDAVVTTSEVLNLNATFKVGVRCKR